MAKPLRPKRGTTAKNDAFTGLASEITIDTEKHSIRVHDGVTAGGHEILPKAKNDELYEAKGVALLKTGGAMEGNIVGNKDKISELVVSSGIGWTGGDATLYMYNANAGDDHGKFRLVAGHHEVFTALEGSPDGSLTWKGDGVITSAGGKVKGLMRYSTLFPVVAETDDMRVHVCGGSNWDTGAHLVLTGKDDGGNGAFELVCQNSDVRIQLQGKPDGSLTWGGNEVDRSIGEAVWINGAWAWYKKFEDGTLLIGSTWAGWHTNEVVTFPVPFAMTPTFVAHSNAGASHPPKLAWSNTTGFMVYDVGYGVEDKTSCWLACGRWK